MPKYISFTKLRWATSPIRDESILLGIVVGDAYVNGTYGKFRDLTNFTIPDLILNTLKHYTGYQKPDNILRFKDSNYKGKFYTTSLLSTLYYGSLKETCLKLFNRYYYKTGFEEDYENTF